MSKETKALAERVLQARLAQLLTQIEAGQDISGMDMASVVKVYQTEEPQHFDATLISFDGLSDDELLGQLQPDLLLDNAARRPSRETTGHRGRKGQGLISSGEPDGR